jgi:hypothetical protein
MSDNDEHRELVAAWNSLNDTMDGLPKRLQWGDTQHMDVTDMADRVRGLSIHLDSAVGLAGQFRYEPALALLRSGLEHCVVDWLVFLGRTMVQRFSGVDDATWDEWQPALPAPTGRRRFGTGQGRRRATSASSGRACSRSLTSTAIEVRSASTISSSGSTAQRWVRQAPKPRSGRSAVRSFGAWPARTRRYGVST